MATKKTPTEEDQPTDTNVRQASASVEPDQETENTPGWLAKRRDAERTAFRDHAQVFSHADGVPTKHAAYVGDVAAHELTQIHAIVARMAWGGPGKYVVWLLDRNTGQKVKGMFATFAVSADLRSEGGATFKGAGGGEMPNLIMALTTALRPQQDPMSASLIQRALDDGADTRVRIGKAYDDGFSAGYARGKIDGAGQWQPKDVVDLVGQLKGILSGVGGGGKAASADPSLLDSFRLAVEEDIPPRTMLRILRTYIGEQVIEFIKNNITTVIEAGQKDPEMAKLLATDKNKQWLLAFVQEVQQ